jgi:protein-tyrosine phosphatase
VSEEGPAPGPLPYPSTREQIALVFREPLHRIGLRILARLMEWLSDLQPKQLNYSQVTPQLAVGGAFRSRQIKLLKARGVTAVVDCRQEALDDQAALAEAGLEFLHLPTPDRYGFTYDQLHSGVDWVLDRLANGGKAFLHCEHGVGRGPLMTCAVLVGQGHSAPQALRIVRSARWQAMPNDRQLAALINFEKEWRAQRG